LIPVSVLIHGFTVILEIRVQSKTFSYILAVFFDASSSTALLQTQPSRQVPCQMLNTMCALHNISLPLALLREKHVREVREMLESFVAANMIQLALTTIALCCR